MLNAVYDASPRWLQTVMMNVFAWRKIRLRYVGRYREFLDELMRMQWADAESLLRWQLRRFAEIFTEARRHVPYWRDLFREHDFDPAKIESFQELRRLPVLEKAQLRADPKAFINPTRKAVYVMRTSGTTGAPMSTPYCKDSLQWTSALMGRFYRSAGVTPKDRSIHLSMRKIVPHSDQEVPWRRNYVDNSLWFSLLHLKEENLPVFFEAMCDFRPLYLTGLPTFIGEIARWVNANGLAGRLRLAAVFTTSETLTPNLRESIETAFATRAYDQYGATEGALIVAQCPLGTYHVVPEAGVVELVRPDGTPAEPGEPAEMIVTSLRNWSRPVLRYRILDTAVGGAGRCPCGRAWPVLEQLTGRRGEWVVTRDGRRISMFSHQVFRVSDNVEESQIIQHAPGRFEVRIVKSPRFGPRDERVIRDRIREILGHPAEIHMEYVDSIPRTTGGKRPSVISHVAEARDPFSQRRQDEAEAEGKEK